MAGAALVVVYEGHELVVDAGTGGLVFGRGATLDVDSNPFLHRQLGRFVDDVHGWWIENLGSWITLNVAHDRAVSSVDPGGRLALGPGATTVRFEAGPCNYQLGVRLLGAHDERPPTPDPDSVVTATCRPGELPLTDEQRLLVLVLAEARLRGDDRPGRLPSNRDAAARLGWTITKYNRKLDWLCGRLDRAGVGGLRADGRRTNERRELLVGHMVRSGQVTVDDLALLDRHERTVADAGSSRVG